MEAANGVCSVPWRRPGKGVASRVPDLTILRLQMSFCSRPFPDKKNATPVVKRSVTSMLTTGSRVQIPPCSRKRVRSSAWIEHVPRGREASRRLRFRLFPGLAADLAVVKASRSSGLCLGESPHGPPTREGSRRRSFPAIQVDGGEEDECIVRAPLAKAGGGRVFKSRPRAPLKGAPVAQVSRKGVSRFARCPSSRFDGGEEIAFFARANADAHNSRGSSVPAPGSRERSRSCLFPPSKVSRW